MSKKLKEKRKELESQARKGFDFSYVLLALVLLVVLVGAYLVFFVPVQSVAGLVIEAHDPIKGQVNAKVTVVEFSDFECPACGAFFPVIKRLSEEFKENVRFVYKDFPLTTIHFFAQKSAEAGQCAFEQGKFWEFHDVLFENQKKLTAPDLKQHAQSLGLDAQKFNQCLDSSKYSLQVAQDFEQGQKIGVNATPTIFINSKKQTSLSYEQLKQAIEQELAK